MLCSGWGVEAWRVAPRPEPHPCREPWAPPHHMSFTAPHGGVFPAPGPIRPQSPARWQGIRDPIHPSEAPYMLPQQLRAKGRWVGSGPGCRFPVPVAPSMRKQRLQFRSGRNHLWFATLPLPTFRVSSPDQRAFNPRPPGSPCECSSSLLSSSECGCAPLGAVLARLRDRIPEPALGFSITEGITPPGCPGGAREPLESVGACRACLECRARPDLERSPLRL